MEIDRELVTEFEKSINTIHPERGKIPINILGYGEISLVFEIRNSVPLAYKRLPIFDSEKQVKRHIQAYYHYNQILRKLGVTVPATDAIWVLGKRSLVLYCIQEKLPSNSFLNSIIHRVKPRETEILVCKILENYVKIWNFNSRSQKIKVGLDGQISNWAVLDWNQTKPQISEETRLQYLDTSTPMFRINGIEAMEPILFLKSAPFFIRWLLKALFLEEVVDRYYDLRLVTIDLVANLFKEQKPELIPRLLKLINDYYSNETDFTIEPITYKEVYDYYQEDKQIWVLFQTVRKIDRWLQTKVAGKQYDFYLPENIDR